MSLYIFGGILRVNVTVGWLPSAFETKTCLVKEVQSVGYPSRCVLLGKKLTVSWHIEYQFCRASRTHLECRLANRLPKHVCLVSLCLCVRP